MTKKSLVLGAGGFIGNHLVERLRNEDYWVCGVDIKHPEYSETKANNFIQYDLRDKYFWNYFDISSYDEIFQLCADMGGSGYIFTKEHDADIMYNSSIVNLNLLKHASNITYKGKIFFSSSACAYAEHNQMDSDNPNCSEDSAYPANPDSEYGWEKLFSERLYFAYFKNYGINVRVARFHNIYGTNTAWDNGKEKAPAAICRKVAMAKDGDTIEVWGPGTQTRSFLYIDECLEGVRRFMDSEFNGPLNIGSEEIITINDLTKMVMEISSKNLNIKNIPGPIGVNGRRSDNNLIGEKLGWKPNYPLRKGMEQLYAWINLQVQNQVDQKMVSK